LPRISTSRRRRLYSARLEMVQTIALSRRFVSFQTVQSIRSDVRPALHLFDLQDLGGGPKLDVGFRMPGVGCREAPTLRAESAGLSCAAKFPQNAQSSLL
jgi:hypothetical protein